MPSRFLAKLSCKFCNNVLTCGWTVSACNFKGYYCRKNDQILLECFYYMSESHPSYETAGVCYNWEISNK